MNIPLDKPKHNKSFIAYHITWIPKYRRKILKGPNAEYCKELIINKSLELNINLCEIEVMPDHIHIFIKVKASVAVSKIIGILKGYISFMLRKKYSKCRYAAHLWTCSYFCESIGKVNEKTIRKYIQNQ